MGVGDTLDNFEPFISFYLGIFGCLVCIILGLLLLVLIEGEKTKHLKKIDFLWGIPGVFLGIIYLPKISLAVAILLGLFIWIPIGILTDLLVKDPDSYLPIVVADISTLFIGALLGAIVTAIVGWRAKQIFTPKVIIFCLFFTIGFVGFTLFHEHFLEFVGFPLLYGRFYWLLILVGIIFSVGIAFSLEYSSFGSVDLTAANLDRANAEIRFFWLVPLLGIGLLIAATIVLKKTEPLLALDNPVNASHDWADKNTYNLAQFLAISTGGIATFAGAIIGKTIGFSWEFVKKKKIREKTIVNFLSIELGFLTVVGALSITVLAAKNLCYIFSGDLVGY